MVHLYNPEESNVSLKPWQMLAMNNFEKMILDKEAKFPCIPAFQGYVLNHFKYGFVTDPRKNESILQLAKLLREYGTVSRKSGNYTALIIFFDTPIYLKNSYSIYDFEKLFWKILNQLALLDEEEWPEQISPDPSHYTWEFCFQKERYFFYCATPAHEKRNSRYFPYFMLAITPRWVLDRFNSSHERAQKMKEQIRKRLLDYDSVSPHPDLKAYGHKDNQEWKQYFLRDDDTTITSCPFHSPLLKEQKK